MLPKNNILPFCCAYDLAVHPLIDNKKLDIKYIEEMNKMAGVNEEAYKTAKENYISATKEMQSALETSLENIQTALENSITSIFETFTNSLLSAA